MSLPRRGGRRVRKMGYESSGPAPRRHVDQRTTVASVEYSHSGLNGWSCTICRQLVDVAGMIAHAKTHRPEEVARAEVLRRVTAALEQLGAGQLAAVAELVPAIAANPVGFVVVARALASGEIKHPGRGLGPSDDQRVTEHLDALGRHAGRAPGTAIDELAIDADTGLPHAGLASARGVLAIQRAEEDRR